MQEVRRVICRDAVGVKARTHSILSVNVRMGGRGRFFDSGERGIWSDDLAGRPGGTLYGVRREQGRKGGELSGI